MELNIVVLSGNDISEWRGKCKWYRLLLGLSDSEILRVRNVY